MTARLMTDNLNAADQPSWAAIKCFYIDGTDRAPQAVIDAWHGPRVLINRTGDPATGGDCLDVEPGCARPEQIAAWFDGRVNLGVKYLTIYSDRDQFAACTAALAGRHAARWLATLDGTVLSTFDGIPLTAVQAFGTGLTHLPWDTSIVFDPAWHPGNDVPIAPDSLRHLQSLMANVLFDAYQLNTALKHL